MDFSGIFDDWRNALQRFCADETCWVVLWTRPDSLPAAMRKKARQGRFKDASTVPLLSDCQRVCNAVKELRDAHAGYIAGVQEALRHIDLLAYPLNAHDALRDVRRCIDPEFTAREWRPLLPGDPLPLRLPDPGAKKILENSFYPSLRQQLWPREGDTVSRQAVRVGDRIYAPLVITLCPQTPRPFHQLFKTLSDREDRLPWRASMLLGPDAMRGSIPFKALIAGLLAFASSNNKRLNAAVERLRKLSLQGMAVVRLQISFCTWVKVVDDFDAAHTLLRRRSAELAKILQGWGTCEVSEVIGDPLLGLSADIPAMMPTSPAPVSGAPLDDAVGLLPIFRLASPWKSGSLILRTQDGKIMPFAPNSSEQAAWVDIGVAPMGAGKSVFLNALNFAFITQPGLSRLPWISIIDVGPSSSGLIYLIREALPPHLRYLAAYHRMRMTPDYAVNPFDTPLGVRTPLPSHRAFLVNFLTLLATPLNAPAVTEAPDIIRKAVDITYEILVKRPSPYDKLRLPELHETIMQDGRIRLDTHTTWWEVTDALFDLGFTHEAVQAQRYAVPVLDDVAAVVNQNPGITSIYPEAAYKSVWRSLMAAGDKYAILKQPSRFDLGDAQIVSLDLDEVAVRGGEVADRQSAVMYLLARHVLGSRFFLMPSDVDLLPPRYKAYHAERIEAIREDPKRLCYEEAYH
jgi:intracellular multiplication protein IcmB